MLADELFAKVNGDFGCASISEMRITADSRIKMGYVVKKEAKWEVDHDKDAEGFDAAYYRMLLENAWDEVAFILAYS